ncbi:hypothetical protein GGX14DRAFT_384038 [Mycena pura]|uniref:Uncharacterized protein n=1 Tax=Mycena pura TaxID=153505 RepID=A0AAD6YVB9_9AGAR|nr:hypothetical protein GGX14DRAFT_384038 [Mycena pura]
MAYYSNNTQLYAIPRSSVHGQQGFAPTTRRHVPWQEWKPKQEWQQNAGRARPAHAPVLFDYPGQARQGVSMRELRLKGPAAPIQGANEPVLAATGLQRIVFRILWPGYGHVEWCRTIPVVAPNGAPITRVALGIQIANNFANFFERSQYEQTTVVDWMVSPAGVQFKQLYLVSLHNTFDDVWQADVVAVD